MRTAITAGTARAWNLVGGSLCLDFVNTVAWRLASRPDPRAAASDRPHDVEKLGSFDDLLSWSVAAGALASGEAARLGRLAARHAGRAARVLPRAVAFREALFRILRSVTGGRAPNRGDLAILNRELAAARAREQLVATAGSFSWRWDESVSALERPLWPVARAAGDLLTSDALGRVRQCAGPDCGWFFLDTTRNHSRQWCDMRDCGNLAKVRRFRQRARRRARGGRRRPAGAHREPTS